MISSATRWLINAASFVALCWMAYVFYGCFSSSGLWKIVEDLWSTDYHRAGPAGVFATCAFIGFIPISAIAWLVWRVALRGRQAEDFPRASLRR